MESSSRNGCSVTIDLGKIKKEKRFESQSGPVKLQNENKKKGSSNLMN